MAGRGRGKGSGTGTKQVTWIVCLVLYLVALAGHFGIVHLSGEIQTWAWILGFGLLLVADKVRGI
jgi:hypothetical protein